MADISTNTHCVGCPHCEETQLLNIECPIGGTVTGTFYCTECGGRFMATVEIVYHVHLET